MILLSQPVVYLTEKERQERLAAILGMQQEYRTVEAEIDAALGRLVDAKTKLARRLETLENAASTGRIDDVEAAESAVDAARGDVEKAESEISRLRGDNLDGDGTGRTASADDPCIDWKFLATPNELIVAFGAMCGLKAESFSKLQGPLKMARKVRGKPGRRGSPGLFCPYEVMTWLVKKKKMRSDTGWRFLKSHFPAAYSKFSSLAEPDV